MTGNHRSTAISETWRVRPRVLSLLEKSPRVTYSTPDIELQFTPVISSILIDGVALTCSREAEGDGFSLAFFHFFSFSLSLSLSLSFAHVHTHDNTQSFSFSLFIFLCFSSSPCQSMSLSQHLQHPTASFLLHSALNLPPCFISTLRPSKRVFGKLSALPKLGATGRFSSCLCKQLGTEYMRPRVDFGRTLNSELY